MRGEVCVGFGSFLSCVFRFLLLIASSAISQLRCCPPHDFRTCTSFDPSSSPHRHVFVSQVGQINTSYVSRNIFMVSCTAWSPLPLDTDQSPRPKLMSPPTGLFLGGCSWIWQLMALPKRCYSLCYNRHCLQSIYWQRFCTIAAASWPSSTLQIWTLLSLRLRQWHRRTMWEWNRWRAIQALWYPHLWHALKLVHFLSVFHSRHDHLSKLWFPRTQFQGCLLDAPPWDSLCSRCFHHVCAICHSSPDIDPQHSGVAKHNMTFLVSTLFAIAGSLLLLIGASIWTVIAQRSAAINGLVVESANGTQTVPLGIIVSVGPGLFLTWAAFACLVVSAVPYMIRFVIFFSWEVVRSLMLPYSCCTYRWRPKSRGWSRGRKRTSH